MAMKIIDLNGHEIAITNLQLAIMQADDFRHYRASEPTEMHLKLQAYWEDFYQKLLKLHLEINEQQ